MRQSDKKTLKGKIMDEIAEVLNQSIVHTSIDHRLHEVVHGPGESYVLVKVNDTYGLTYFEINIKESQS